MDSYRSIVSVLDLKTRAYHPGLVWGVHKGGDSSPRLHWGKPDDSMETLQTYRVEEGRTKRHVRRAVNGFLKIAKSYEKNSDDDAFMQEIAEFASSYGDMFGRPPVPVRMNWLERCFPDTLEGWKIEALTFIDAYELRTAFQDNQALRGMKERTQVLESDGSVWFTTRAKIPLSIAKGVNKLTVQSHKDDQQRVVYPAQIARNGGERLNWMIFSRLVESRLEGNLKLTTDPDRRDNIGITPTGIIPTMYARLLRDHLESRVDAGLNRICANDACDNPIPDTRRSDTDYCSDRCRKADSRRRARQAGIA